MVVGWVQCSTEGAVEFEFRVHCHSLKKQLNPQLTLKMLRSVSVLLRATGGSHVSRQAVGGSSAYMTSRTFCAAAKKSKAKKVKKAKKGEPEENDKEEEWIANLIDTAEAVRK